MKGGIERSTRGAATAAQILTDQVNGVAGRTVQKDLEALHRKKLNGATRNAVLFGPTDSDNQPSALFAGLNPLDLKVKGSVTPITISFAKGFDKDSGPIDTVVSITTDEVVNLPALDDNTVPINYTTDLCTGGTAISGGDSQPAVNAFDNSVSSSWAASQLSANQSGNASIGYNFGTSNAKHIRRIALQHSSLYQENSVTSVKIQRSDNGTTWTEVKTATGLTLGKNIVDLQSTQAAQYWRLLAQSNLANGYSWSIYEIEMFEALETLYVYAEKVGEHGYQLGYTKQKPRYDVVSDTYTDNLCKGGAAISGGDNASYPKEKAFNADTSTWWQSSQTSTAVSGAAYIGYMFSAPKHARRVKYWVGGQAVSSVKVQKSDNGTAWTDVGTYATSQVSGDTVTIDLPVTTTAQYWRLLANSNTNGGGGWAVHELEVYELATDLHFYDQVAETMKHWNGTTWEQKERVFIGEAYTTTTALYGQKTYDYDTARLSVAPATLAGMPVNLGQFESLLSANGWQQLPGGLIMQWGISGAVAAGGAITVTLPLTFPNNCYSVVATAVGASSSSSNSGIGISIINNSQFIVYDWGEIAFTSGVRYFAIGN